MEIGRLAAYDGPTWLDEAIIGKLQVQEELPGVPAELRQALADRGRWLAGRGLADLSGSNEVAPKPDMMRSLRRRETATPSRRDAVAPARRHPRCAAPDVAEASGRSLKGIC
jgi:hypothetical protein